MTRALSLVIPLVLGYAVHGQSGDGPCKAQELTLNLLQEMGLPGIRASLPRIDGEERGGILRVPVVVHVVWNTSNENVPSSAIIAMLNQLNLDLSQSNTDITGVRPPFVASIADVGIEFCLAQVDPQGNTTTGITRTQTSATWFDPVMQTNAMKSPPLGVAPWNTSQYLNIWICDISSGATGGSITRGYAFMPVGGVVGSAVDGLVIDFQYGLPAYTRTATHEIGHYLGLMHTWGEGGCDSDDGFADTPDTDSPTYSCANISLQKCGTLTQYENFMDYSNCSIMFTHEQRTYMRGILNGVRSELTMSAGCGDIIQHTGPSADEAGRMKIHPNPARHAVTVEHPYGYAGLIHITDALGREVATHRTMGPTTTIGLQGIPPGTYLLRVIHGGASATERLVIIGAE